MADQKAWAKALRSREISYGSMMDTLSRTEFDVLTYIGATPRTTIQEIDRAFLFQNVTLSTIKRAVQKLKDLGVLSISLNENDGRERLIQLKH